jgi:hypothetical protein
MILECAMKAGQLQLLPKLIMRCAMKAGQLQLLPKLIMPFTKADRKHDGMRLDQQHAKFLSEALRDAAAQPETAVAGAVLAALCPLDICAALHAKAPGQTTTFQSAAQQGDEQLTCHLLEACLHIDLGDIEHKTLQLVAVRAAIEHKRLELITVLLSKGACVNGGRPGFASTCSPLATAIDRHASADVVKLLLDSGAHVLPDSQCPQSSQPATSALAYALCWNNVEACEVLVKEYGHSVGEMELTAAARYSHGSVLSWMLEQEANMQPELRAGGQRRAACLGRVLVEAVERGDPGSVEALLSCPAHWGPVTPAVLDAGVRQVEKLLKRRVAHLGHTRVIALLRKAGAEDVVATCLVAAIEHGNECMIKVVLYAGVKYDLDPDHAFVDLIDLDLHIARLQLYRAGMCENTDNSLSLEVRRDRQHVCSILLNNFEQHLSIGMCELLATVKTGRCWLLEAVLKSEASWEAALREDAGRRAEVLQQLIKPAVWADWVEERTWSWETPKRASVLQVLLDPPACWGPVTPAALADGVRELAEYLLRKSDVAEQDLCGAVKALCKAGADLDLDGGALLAAAVARNKAQVVEALIAAGVDVRVNGGAALQATEHSYSLCCALLKHGANPCSAPEAHMSRLVQDDDMAPLIRQLLGRWSDKGTWGQGLLRAAIVHQRASIADLLVRAGVVLELGSEQMRDTVLSMAAQGGSEQMLQLLAAQPSAACIQVSCRVGGWGSA